jgi:hypothetical protein
MSLKNKYKVVKEYTGTPVKSKLYSNSQTFGDMTVIMKCINMNDDLYLKYFDGIPSNGLFFDSDKTWEVELIASENKKDNQNISSTDIKKLTFPCEMFVGDDNENFTIRTVLAYLGDDFDFPWIIDQDFCEYKKGCNFYGFKYARLITDDFIYLSLQDISDGKGVGIDPSLIKIKE